MISIWCLSVLCRVRTCGHVDGKGVEAKLNLRRASSGLRQRCSSRSQQQRRTENGRRDGFTASVEKRVSEYSVSAVWSRLGWLQLHYSLLRLANARTFGRSNAEGCLTDNTLQQQHRTTHHSSKRHREATFTQERNKWRGLPARCCWLLSARNPIHIAARTRKV